MRTCSKVARSEPMLLPAPPVAGNIQSESGKAVVLDTSCGAWLFDAATGVLNVARCRHVLGVRQPLPKGIKFLDNAEFDSFDGHQISGRRLLDIIAELDEAKQYLPKVSGLINCPVIYECNGEIKIAGPGYDAHTERIVTGGKLPEEVDFRRARSALLAVLDDFDFQSEGDKSRAVASFIAPALKMGGFLNDRVPADIAEADQSQAGKGYRQKVLGAIYNELLSIVANRKGGVGSLDESFSYQLLEGHPFIQFDNLRGKLESQLLEAFFTADGKFSCRIPYRPIVNVHGAHYFIFLTSNGLETTRDLANRSAIIRIRKHPQDYQFKKYHEGDLLAHVRANQAFYLGCVFSIIREWCKAGKPRSDETRHDFKEWVQVMDWIVQNHFGLASLMDGHSEAQQLVSDPDMVFLRQVCNAVERGEALEEPQAALEIAVICDAESIGIPGLRYSGDLQRCAQQAGSCLGRIFKTSDSVSVDDYRVERQVSSKKRKDDGGYFDAKTYVFKRASKPQTPQQGSAPERQQAQSKTPTGESEAKVEPLCVSKTGPNRISFGLNRRGSSNESLKVKTYGNNGEHLTAHEGKTSPVCPESALEPARV